MIYDKRTRTITYTEWFVLTDTYHGDGANWTELMKAIRAAHQELGISGDAPENQITIHPHDEHVVVRIERETTDVVPAASPAADQVERLLWSIWNFNNDDELKALTLKMPQAERDDWADTVDRINKRQKLHRPPVTRWWYDHPQED